MKKLQDIVYKSNLKQSSAQTTKERQQSVIKKMKVVTCNSLKLTSKENYQQQ